MKPVANLEQLMLGVMYPSANVIIAAGETDPLQIPLADDPVTTTDPLGSLYGGWRAVENASVAIIETTGLIMLPGRKCSGGVDVPIQNPEFKQFLDKLRGEATAAYDAAKNKDQAKLKVAATELDETCDNCHEKFLENREPPDRCK